MERITLLLSIVIGVVATGWAYYEHERCARYINHFVDYEFNIARNITITRWRPSGALWSIGYDLNEDLVDDSVVVYSQTGKAATIWVDENFNGREEVEYLYSRTGELIARYEDREEDGYVEEYIRYTPDSLFLYRDTDQNGYYASSEIIRSASRD